MSLDSQEAVLSPEKNFFRCPRFLALSPALFLHGRKDCRRFLNLSDFRHVAKNIVV